MFTEEHLGRLEFSRAATELRGSLLAVLYSKTRCGCCREFYLPAACKGDRGFISKAPPGGGSLSHCLDALLRQLHVCFLAAFTGLTSCQVSLFKAASAKHCATFSQEGEVTLRTAQTLRPMSSLKDIPGNAVLCHVGCHSLMGKHRKKTVPSTCHAQDS